MNIYEVFTPHQAPTVTYVERAELKLEEKLKLYYETPNLVVSLSGPSKSGKTVLINKVISNDVLISVIGSGVVSADNLWERVLQWMDVPASTQQAKTSKISANFSAKGGGEVGVPFVAKGKAEATAGVAREHGKATNKSYYQDPLMKVIEEISGSEFVIFIDDFHYIDEALREEIGRQIKVASEAGVKFLTASVPHRTDDVVRSNPELRGRVAAVDLQYWNVRELTRIPRQGFAALNLELDPKVELRLASEAMGSPQLMQTICLNLCMVKGISGQVDEQRRLLVDEDDIKFALLATSGFTDFTKMFNALLSGPRVRGTERKIHTYSDNSAGDVYRAVLLAISSDPANLSFSYDDLQKRIAKICTTDIPSGSSVNSALEQMHIIAENIQPNSSPISWDNDNLDIVDPYFLFFIRCSEKLAENA